MGNKKIKVRCTEAIYAFKIGEIYLAKENVTKNYLVIDDDGEDFSMESSTLTDYFEIVEDVLMVECINNDNSNLDFTIGKKYAVIDKVFDSYKLYDDKGNENIIWKSRFKKVESQKEVKEYTFKEVIENIKDDEIYKFSDITIKQVNGAITIYKEKAFSDGETLGFWFYDAYKFIKIQEHKLADTAEAFKALNEGKMIESLYSHNRYFKDGNEIVEYDLEEKSITFEELEGQWIIKGDSEWENV